MFTKSPVFEETYKKYLEKIARIEFKSLEEKLGVKAEKDGAIIPFLGKSYIVSEKGITDPSGKHPPLEISVVLCNYIIRCPVVKPTEDDWVSYRDFKDSGPLTSYYANSVEKPIASYFSSKLGELEKSCIALGGSPPDIELSYELTMQFNALPRVPILLLFNDADDEFPAHCSLLFERRAEKFLDAESLAILGMLLSIYLRKKANKDFLVKYA